LLARPIGEVRGEARNDRGEHRDGEVARRLAEREARRRGERMDDDGPPEAALTDVSAHRLSIGLAAPP
jgi:hypothetical protein